MRCSECSFFFNTDQYNFEKKKSPREINFCFKFFKHIGCTLLDFFFTLSRSSTKLNLTFKLYMYLQHMDVLRTHGTPRSPTRTLYAIIWSIIIITIFLF